MFQHTHEEIIIGPVVPRTGKWHGLAEAIREGCKKRPIQAFGTMWMNDNAACVLGAALEMHFQGRVHVARECPACGKPEKKGFGPNGLCLLPHLNDDHRWTRERIADWLDTL